MDHNQPDWNLLRAFAATAEAGSLSAAARQLGLSQPTLSRQIAALESRLSLMLFERNGRYLQLTDAGRELLPHARDMGAAARQMALVASGQQSDLSGLVRITASEVYSAYLLPPILKDLRRRAPQITSEIVAGDDIRNLMAREADIALRNVRPEQPNLVARLVSERTGYFYAATSYLDTRGRPETIPELQDHDWIGMGDTDRYLGYMAQLGLALTADHLPLRSVSGIAAWEMCKAGLGILPMDREIAKATPGLEPLLPEHLAVSFPIWLVAHREVHTSPRIRLVFDLLAEALSA